MLALAREEARVAGGVADSLRHLSPLVFDGWGLSPLDLFCCRPVPRSAFHHFPAESEGVVFLVSSSPCPFLLTRLSSCLRMDGVHYYVFREGKQSKARQRGKSTHGRVMELRDDGQQAAIANASRRNETGMDARLVLHRRSVSGRAGRRAHSRCFF